MVHLAKTHLQIFYFRDSLNKLYSYETIACIEFQGTVTSAGDSQGHYICDVKNNSDGRWFRTNDNKEPKEIDKCDVSDVPYIVLLKRK